MKFLLMFFGFIFLLSLVGCARQDVKPGETMFKESNATFDSEDGKFKIPFDIPQAEKTDQTSEAKSQTLK